MAALQRKNKLQKLLNETNEAYYWLGFLLADGHFSENGRLTIGLSKKDIDHLYKLKEFLQCGNVREYTVEGYACCAYAVMDVNTVLELKNKYNIASNKTKNPPIIKNLSEDQKFCVMIGFIDGDGNIQQQTGRTDVKLAIKVHVTWLSVISWLFNKEAYLNAKGYAFLTQADNSILREYKQKAINLGLPILARKWDKIDGSRVSRYKTAKSWTDKAILLKSKGLSIKEISEILVQKYTTVYNALKRKELI